MPRIIALAQQKGGVGKSTLAIHMAVEIDVRRDKNVLIVDMDPQGTVTKWRERREALGKHDPSVIRADAGNLEKAIASAGQFEFILLDLPGRRGEDMLAGMRKADFIIVPSRPLDIDIEASGETIAAAQRLGKPYAFAMTVVPPDGRRAQEYKSAIKARGYPVLSAVVGQRLSYPDAIAMGLGVAESEPKSKAALEMSDFTTAVLKGMK